MRSRTRPTRGTSALFAVACAFTTLLVLGAGCSDNNGNDGDDGGGSVDTGPLVCPGAKAPEAGEFAPNCCGDEDCKESQMCVQGVCAARLDSGLTSSLTDPADDDQPIDTPIETGCNGKSTAELVAGLPTGVSVTMWGRVDRFGGGGLTDGVEVSVFLAKDFHPEACAGIKGSKAIRTCMHDESKVGKPIATVVSVTPEAGVAKGWAVKAKYKPDQECTKNLHLECPLGYLCDKFDGYVKCGKAHGVYAIEAIPTNVRLVVRASPVDPSHPDGWRDSYVWNVVLLSDHLDAMGEGSQPTAFLNKQTYRFNPTIVGKAQWVLVPTTMSLGKISSGNGVIGGRVRDCGKDDRASWAVLDTKISAGVRGAGQSYFNDSESDTVPSKKRTTTNVLGRYAIINIEPGPNRVVVTGRVGAKDTVLGWADVYVIPDALVLASLPGYVPKLKK